MDGRVPGRGLLAWAVALLFGASRRCCNMLVNVKLIHGGDIAPTATVFLDLFPRAVHRCTRVRRLVEGRRALPLCRREVLDHVRDFWDQVLYLDALPGIVLDTCCQFAQL